MRVSSHVWVILLCICFVCLFDPIKGVSNDDQSQKSTNESPGSSGGEGQGQGPPPPKSSLLSRWPTPSRILSGILQVLLPLKTNPQLRDLVLRVLVEQTGKFFKITPQTEADAKAIVSEFNSGLGPMTSNPKPVTSNMTPQLTPLETLLQRESNEGLSQDEVKVKARLSAGRSLEPLVSIVLKAIAAKLGGGLLAVAANHLINLMIPQISYGIVVVIEKVVTSALYLPPVLRCSPRSILLFLGFFNTAAVASYMVPHDLSLFVQVISPPGKCSLEGLGDLVMETWKNLGNGTWTDGNTSIDLVSPSGSPLNQTELGLPEGLGLESVTLLGSRSNDSTTSSENVPEGLEVTPLTLTPPPPPEGPEPPPPPSQLTPALTLDQEESSKMTSEPEPESQLPLIPPDLKRSNRHSKPKPKPKIDLEKIRSKPIPQAQLSILQTILTKLGREDLLNFLWSLFYGPSAKVKVNGVRVKVGSTRTIVSKIDNLTQRRKRHPLKGARNGQGPQNRKNLEIEGAETPRGQGQGQPEDSEQPLEAPELEETLGTPQQPEDSQSPK